VQRKTTIGIGTGEYLRKVLTESLGERRAATLLGRILKGRESTGIDALKWMDPRTVAEVIKSEHPQIIATILAHLPSQQAADVLSRFDGATQADLALRVARLDEVPEAALQELDAIVERQTKEATALRTSRLGGVKSAADMLNLLGPAVQSGVLEAIKSADEKLGEQIKDALFVFANLLKLDDRGMQAILREVQADVLATALKGADEEIQEKIFKNMSKRAAEILRDDIATKGPVRLSEVEQAQKDVLSVALRLAEEGQIMLAAGGEEFV
jgi:flagellar motor switch protein FliG